MEQGPSSEAKSPLALQEIPCLLWNMNVQYLTTGLYHQSSEQILILYSHVRRDPLSGIIFRLKFHMHLPFLNVRYTSRPSPQPRFNHPMLQINENK
jgi:hypothetical protein